MVQFRRSTPCAKPSAAIMISEVGFQKILHISKPHYEYLNLILRHMARIENTTDPVVFDGVGRSGVNLTWVLEPPNTNNPPPRQISPRYRVLF